MVDGGWILYRICYLKLLEPLNLEKVVFCGKVLICSEDPNCILEGAKILSRLSYDNE